MSIEGQRAWRQASANGGWVRRIWWAVALLAVGLLVVGAAGCRTPLVDLRNQSPDEQLPDPIPEPVSTATLIRDVAVPTGLGFMEVEGVALVLNLDGTGSNPPESPMRAALVDEMQTHDAYSPAEILQSPSTSLALVRSYLPPACQKGDRIDVEVYLPRGSETTSLDGGWLMLTRMREHLVMGRSMRTGHVAALGQGPVLVDASFSDEKSSKLELQGRVPGGARVVDSRKLGLALKDEHASAAKAAVVARTINARFTYFDHGVKRPVATPKNKIYIELELPSRYKHNVGRYLKVVRSIALGESPAARGERLRALEAMLLEPTSSAVAAVRLEAIGQEAEPVLRKALGTPHPVVQFHAAEALAYMDVADAADALGLAARNERAFRWHALTALATMDHVAALDVLTDLLSASSSETRYGAFVAMRVRNPRDPLVAGELLNDQFHLHKLDSSGEPLVHFSTRRRPEIVLIGRDHRLDPPAFLFAGKKIMLKGQPDGRIRIKRFAPSENDDRVVVVEPTLDRVIRAIADLGGNYGDVYQALRDAKQNGYLPARLVVDAVPRAGRRRDEAAQQPEGPEGRLPELFDDALSRPSPETAADRGEIDAPSFEEDGRRLFGRMKDWLDYRSH